MQKKLSNSLIHILQIAELCLVCNFVEENKEYSSDKAATWPQKTSGVTGYMHLPCNQIIIFRAR